MKSLQKLDDLGRLKNSSSVKLSPKIITILDKLVSEELSELKNSQTMKSYFLEIAEEFELQGIPKKEISKQTLLTIEQYLFEKLSAENIPKEQCKLSVSSLRHLQRTMKSAGYTNPAFARNKKTDYKEPKFTVKPEGLEFTWLHLTRELFVQSISAIDVCMGKCILDKTSIRSQIDSNTSKTTQSDYDVLLKKKENLVNKRISNVREELSKIKQQDIEKIKSMISRLKFVQKKLNDKTKLTKYEKEFARILIERFAYDNGSIASILNIDTKHIKNNILKQNSNPHNQDSILKQLEFLARCPDCGLGIADYIDEQHDNFIKGKSLNDTFELENFPIPKYADQVIQLKQKIREQKIEIAKLKKK